MLDTMTKEIAIKRLAVIKAGIAQLEESSGYCEHGNYVGGCGADYMCQYCEDGHKRNAYVEAIAEAKRAIEIQKVEFIQKFLCDGSPYELLRFIKQHFSN